MNKPVIKEAIIVEGRYDKNTLSQLVDALIIETKGFHLFHDETMRKMLRNLAVSCGIIILTDSDSAGFLIRSRIRSFVPEGRVLNAYIPDLYGKEKRKSTPGREGKLGVEGMEREVLLKALKDAGATFGEERPLSEERITVADLYHVGLTGRRDSREKRRELLQELSLPEHLSTKALADVLSRRMTRDELFSRMSQYKNAEICL